MLMVLVVTCNCGFAGTIERIEGNRPLRVGKIRRNRATIALAKFLSTLSRVPTSLSGFQRVAVLPIGLVRKAAVDDRRMRIFWIFLSNF